MKLTQSLAILASTAFLTGECFFTSELENIFEKIKVTGNIELFTLNSSCPIPFPNKTINSFSDSYKDQFSPVSLFGIQVDPSSSMELVYESYSKSQLFSLSDESGCDDHPTFQKYLDVVNSAAIVLERSSEIGYSLGQNVKKVEICITDNEMEMNKRNLLFGNIQMSKNGQVFKVTMRKSLVDSLSVEVPDFVSAYYEESIESIKRAEKEGRLNQGNLLLILPQIISDSTAKMFQVAFEQDVIACFICIIVGGILVPLVANIIMYLIGLRLCDVCELSESVCSQLLIALLYLVYLLIPVLAAILWNICKQYCL